MANQNGQRFVETMRSWLSGLPHDLKILFEATTDENLSREARELATGAIIYVVSPNDMVSNDGDSFAGYADDCIMLRLALQKALAEKDEDNDFFKSRFPEFFESLQAELEICQGAMPELFAWLETKIPLLLKLEHKSKKVKQYLDDDELSEQLYEDGLEFRTEYPVDEDDLADRFKKASTVIEGMQRRKDQENRQ